MFPYVVLYWFWAVVAWAVRRRRDSTVLALLFTLFLILFAGTRFKVGCDSDAYALRFDSMYQGMTWTGAIAAGEGGFNWLNMALRGMGQPFSALLLACGVIFAVCLYRFSKLAERPLSMLVLAFPVLVVQLDMSGLRQAMAAAFLLLAMVAFVRRHRMQVLLWVVVASQFHTSALVFAPIALLTGRKVSTGRMLGMFLIAAPLVGFFLGNRLEVYNNRYVAQIYGEQSSDGAWFRYILVLVPFLGLLWKQRAVELEFPRIFPLMRLYALMSLALLPVGLISSVALHRFVFYVMPVSILALLCLGETLFRSSNRRLGALLPFMAYGAYITVWFAFSSHGTSCYMPYQSWLLGTSP